MLFQIAHHRPRTFNPDIVEGTIGCGTEEAADCERIRSTRVNNHTFDRVRRPAPWFHIGDLHCRPLKAMGMLIDEWLVYFCQHNCVSLQISLGDWPAGPSTCRSTCVKSTASCIPFRPDNTLLSVWFIHCSTWSFDSGLAETGVAKHSASATPSSFMYFAQNIIYPFPWVVTSTKQPSIFSRRV